MKLFWISLLLGLMVALFVAASMEDGYTYLQDRTKSQQVVYWVA
jgi:hypothetical protein